jgi:hypothetical protein
MVFPAVGEGTNVVDVDFCVFNIAEYVFHGFLGEIRRTFESHWQYIVSVFAKWRDNGRQVFGSVIQCKRVLVLHGYVDLGEKGIP